MCFYTSIRSCPEKSPDRLSEFNRLINICPHPRRPNEPHYKQYKRLTTDHDGGILPTGRSRPLYANISYPVLVKE